VVISKLTHTSKHRLHRASCIPAETFQDSRCNMMRYLLNHRKNSVAAIQLVNITLHILTN